VRYCSNALRNSPGVAHSMELGDPERNKLDYAIVGFVAILVLGRIVHRYLQELRPICLLTVVNGSMATISIVISDDVWSVK